MGFESLHDTNHKEFFTKSERSLSSGCVSVDNPLELTEYLLDDTTYWNLEKISETLQSEKNTLLFRDDIYNLDADLYDKLRK